PEGLGDFTPNRLGTAACVVQARSVESRELLAIAQAPGPEQRSASRARHTDIRRDTIEACRTIVRGCQIVVTRLRAHRPKLAARDGGLHILRGWAIGGRCKTRPLYRRSNSTPLRPVRLIASGCSILPAWWPATCCRCSWRISAPTSSRSSRRWATHCVIGTTAAMPCTGRHTPATNVRSC